MHLAACFVKVIIRTMVLYDPGMLKNCALADGVACRLRTRSQRRGAVGLKESQNDPMPDDRDAVG